MGCMRCIARSILMWMSSKVKQLSPTSMSYTLQERSEMKNLMSSFMEHMGMEKLWTGASEFQLVGFILEVSIFHTHFSRTSYHMIVFYILESTCTSKWMQSNILYAAKSVNTGIPLAWVHYAIMAKFHIICSSCLKPSRSFPTVWQHDFPRNKSEICCY